MRQKKLKARLLHCLPMKKLLIMLFAINLMVPIFAQEVQISGTITDSGSGDPLPGVSVRVEGTTTGGISDVNGKYSVKASKNAIIEFSFMGYLTEKITVAEQTTIDVKLVSDIKKLDEVVVIGYGSVKKKDLTGSVASVKSAELVATAPKTVQQALQGKAAGVLVAGNNSSVNNTPSIRVRGNRSINASNDPFYVVDGIPTWNIETINPSDIESLEILKDASATAIYGSRGANGVILITTKKGESGKVSVEYDGYTTVGKLDRIRRAYNAAEYSDYVRDSYRSYTYDGNGGYALATNSVYGSENRDWNIDRTMAIFTTDPSGYVQKSLEMGYVNGVWTPSAVRNFDWQMAGFRDHSVTQNHTISVKGGTKNTKVYLSGSYMDANDMQIQSNRKRYTLRLNVEQTIGKHLTVGSNLSYAYTEWQPGKGIATFWSPLGNPYYSPGGYGANGVGGDVTQTGDPKLGIIPNPAGELLQTNSFYDFDGYKNSNKNNNLNTNFFVQVKIIEGLTYRANYGRRMNINQDQKFWSKYSTTAALGDPRASQTFTFERNWTFENILSYNKQINKHSFGITLGQTNEKYISEPASVTGVNIPLESTIYYDLGSSVTQSVSTGYTQTQMMSYLGRLTYSFKDRYLFTGTMRYDGASVLAEGHKWVAFPSASVAWRVSEESFLKNNPIVSNLKLLVGYGVTANSSVGAYNTIGTIRTARYNWDKGTGAFGFEPSSLSNPALGWEQTGQYNAALEFGVLKNRISGKVEAYQQKTTDLLLNRSLPQASGFSNLMQNVGETENKGIEVALTTQNIDNKKISWSTTVTFSANREKITSLYNNLERDLGNSWFVGKPINTYYDYVAAPRVWGYSATDMAEMAKFNANGSSFKPGDIRLVDLNGDYRITADDREIRGSRMPKWSGSLSNNFRYGPFDLYFIMYGMFGQTVYWDPGISYIGRYNSIKAPYWTPTRTETKYPKPVAGTSDPANLQSMMYWKGDFLKVSDITLGYTLPKALLQKLTISSVRVYAKVQNPFMWTKFEGNDPEGAVQQGGVGRYGDFPYTMKMYTFGLNVTF